MKYLALILLFTAQVIGAEAKTVTDMAGRKFEVPPKVERILPYDPHTSILLFPAVADKMVARAMLPGTENYNFITEDYNNLPEVDIKNLEEVMLCKPQLIIAGVYLSKNRNMEPYNKLQKRTNIPVVVVDLTVDKLDKTYRFLGQLLGAVEDCSKLSNYIETLYFNTKALVATTSLNGISVYYTLGNTGLMTDPAGSKHTEVFDYLKIPNAAKVDIPSGGHAKVNMEQVMIWNPDYIFTADFRGGNSAYNTITSSPLWADIKAVKQGKVYRIPRHPFGWFDHPPSINRISGIIWLSEIFYGLPPEESKRQIIEFYKLFYQYKLNDEEYNALWK